MRSQTGGQYAELYQILPENPAIAPGGQNTANPACGNCFMQTFCGRRLPGRVISSVAEIQLKRGFYG
jgi:hypothetical protein